MSKCGNCGNFSFSLEEVSPNKSNFKFYFIQCSSCGVPVGVVDYNHTGSLIHKLEKKLDYLSNAVETVDQKIQIIARKLR